MNTAWLDRPWPWLAVLLAISSLLGYAYYLQFVEYLDPCPLCITQRLFYYLIGIAALLALLSWRWRNGRRFWAATMGLSAVFGLGTASRQVWLQHLPPDKVPECGPGLSYWLQNEPWLSTLQLLFKGDGNCAEVDWQFLGLSMAGWSGLWFAALLLLSLLLLFRPRRLD